ncbi:MAG: hypothetical protein ABIZ56_09065 [Chthoniobacteraceae bacterium]
MNAENESSGGRSFSATRWSVVLAAAGEVEGALASLCRAYWFPLYAFLRRQGLGPEDAEDVTQGFFAHLLGKGALARVDRAKGRFRTFLLASLKHFLADQRDRANAQKRGEGAVAISMDAVTAEERYALEPRDELSPDKLFDRRWAVAVIEQALARLGAEYSAAGKGALFGALKPLLSSPSEARPYAEIGAQFSMNEGAVKIAVHRLRQRYGAALRAEIAETVGTAEEVEAELRHLLDAL